MKKHLIFIALLAVVSMSCRQTTTPTIVVAPYLGEMTGRVVPIDVNGDSLPNLLAGTTAFIKGTSFITTTDSTGQWTFKNLPAGIYTVLLARKGFDTVGYDLTKLSGAGVDFMDDRDIVRMTTDTMVLDYAVVRDSIIGGNHFPTLFFGGHISSDKLQNIALYANLDSASTNQNVESFSVKNGMFSGASLYVSFSSSNNLSVNLTDIRGLDSGRKIFVCTELYPLNGYPDVAGSFTHDYSNILEVTVP